MTLPSPTRRSSDLIGGEGQGRLDLVGDDLRDELSPHREVGVREVVHLPGEYLRDAVGPATDTSGGAGLGVADALGERVTDCDITAPRVRSGVHGVRGSGGDVGLCRHRSSGPQATAPSRPARSDASPKVVSRAGRRGEEAWTMTRSSLPTLPPTATPISAASPPSTCRRPTRSAPRGEPPSGCARGRPRDRKSVV